MTDPMPEVSVVMGVRDDAAALPATVASVLAQEGVALELIVVDDGSTGATPDFLASLSRRDSRVRPLRQDAAGLTTALVRGCAAARAPLVARQDAGDLSLPGRLAQQKEAFDRHPEIALASCFTACVGPRGEELRIERGPRPADRPFSVLDSTSAGALPGPTAHGSAIFRRAAYERAGGYRAPFALAQDWDLWLRLADLGPCLVVGQILYQREISPRSLSFRFHRLQRAFGEAAFAASRERRAGRSEEPYLERARALGDELAAARRHPSRRAEALGHYHVGQLLRDRGDRRSLGYFRAALARDPFLLRAWVRALQASVGAGGRS